MTIYYQLYEELLALGIFNGKTRDIDNNFEEQFHKVELNTNNLSVFTGGAPAMMANIEGFTAHLKR